jgi:hypothetical protein
MINPQISPLRASNNSVSIMAGRDQNDEAPHVVTVALALERWICSRAAKALIEAHPSCSSHP